MEMTNGSVVHASAINFNSYRENSFDLSGTKGRFVLTQEGSYYQFWKKQVDLDMIFLKLIGLALILVRLI